MLGQTRVSNRTNNDALMQQAFVNRHCRPTHIDQNEIRHMLEMLVRAYDPCISCSVHALDVEFA